MESLEDRLIDKIDSSRMPSSSSARTRRRRFADVPRPGEEARLSCYLCLDGRCATSRVGELGACADHKAALERAHRALATAVKRGQKPRGKLAREIHWHYTSSLPLSERQHVKRNYVKPRKWTRGSCAFLDLVAEAEASQEQRITASTRHRLTESDLTRAMFDACKRSTGATEAVRRLREAGARRKGARDMGPLPIDAAWVRKRLQALAAGEPAAAAIRATWKKLSEEARAGESLLRAGFDAHGGHLSEGQRLAFYYYVIRRMTLRATAARFQATEGTVKSHLARVRTKLSAAKVVTPAGV